MKDTIESKTAATLLQDPIAIKVGRHVYRVKPATLATLVRMSQYISFMPEAKMDENDPLTSVLHNAKDCAVMARVLAIAILGERKRGMVLTMAHKMRIWALSRYIADRCTPTEMLTIYGHIVKMLGVGDFFVLTTFLSDAKTTKATKKKVD